MANKKRSKRKNVKINGKNLSWLSVIILVAAVFFQPLFAQYGLDFETFAKLLEPPTKVSSQPVEGTAEVHFIDVGQGVSVLIKGKEKTALIDVGEAEAAVPVVNYLRSNGVQQIDYFFASHPHADHIGGCRTVLREVPTKEFIMTALPDKAIPTTATYTKLLGYLNENKANIQSKIASVGEVYDLGGGLTIEVVGPVKLYDDLNETSLVLRVEFGETSFLVTGDMEKGSQKDMVDANAVEKVDVLSAPHHGSSTSINKEFMEILSPKYSVISCGKDNDYGHPHQQTLDLYQQMGIEYYRTDKQGNIKIVTDGSNIEFFTEK